MARASILRIVFFSLKFICLLLVGILTSEAQALLSKSESRRETAARKSRRETAARKSVNASFLPRILNGRDIRLGGEDPATRNVLAHQALVCDDDEEGSLCPVSCFRPDPVCGEDGVTYWCGCKDARCAGVSVSHGGFCKIRSSASAERGSQALLLLHTLWLALIGFCCTFGLL